MDGKQRAMTSDVAMMIATAPGKTLAGGCDAHPRHVPFQPLALLLLTCP
jgi:hypothetical protein